MRITISHNSSKAEVIKTVDRSFDDMFEHAPGLPVRLLVKQRSWQGSVLTFSLSAKWGLLSTPIEGTVTVTDQDVTVDADLGLLRGLIPEKLAREVIGNRVKGLLR
jgi:Putative polyhydroxyalkanoic acid system protein (PHA_gran_rgn)